MYINYGNIEEIMDRIDHEKKGRIMNIKENFYIYMCRHENKFIEEQKILTDQYRNALHDVAVTYRDIPTPTNRQHVRGLAQAAQLRATYTPTNTRK
jgi:hypothetical protein